METTVETQSRLRTLYYWMLLIVTLVIVDDLLFGPFFWLLSQVDVLLSVVVALCASWAYGYWLAIRGLKPEPGKLAEFFLSRLQLERKNHELAVREAALRDKITSVAAAVPMTLLFGGTVTTLWLRRRNIVDDQAARTLAFWLCGLYAVEFMLIHALGIGGGIFIARQ